MNGVKSVWAFITTSKIIHYGRFATNIIVVSIVALHHLTVAYTILLALT